MSSWTKRVTKDLLLYLERAFLWVSDPPENVWRKIKLLQTPIILILTFIPILNIATIIATIGEMILLPTSTNYLSQLAPEDKRARYMSLYTITWSIGTGLGPLIGGILNDQISPSATWIGTGLLGLIGTALFYFFARRPKN